MYKLITYSDELYHYGVMGMRWGVRRYQNYDGTRISEGDPPAVDSSKVADGNGDAAEDKKSKSIGEEFFGPSVKKGKGKEDTSVAQETTKHLLELNRANKDLVKGLKEVDPKVKEANEKQEKSLTKKAKKMSDKELRDSINRIKMEREYVSLNKQEVKTGYDKALDIMDKAEPFVRVAAEVAGLILLLYKIKGMSHSAMDDQIVDVCRYCVDNGFNNDIIKHAMDLDVEYIIDYYNVSDNDLECILCGEDYLEHHGVKGMKWGVRRYQNYDGTRIGVGSGSGGGGGGSNKASKSFRDTIVGGQGGKATGNARLAATVGQMKKEREEKQKQKALEKEWNEWSKGGWTKDYNEASKHFNLKLEEINNKYGSEADDFQKRTGLNGNAEYVEDWVANTTKEGFDYLHEIDDAWRTEYTNAIKKNHKNSELIEK